MERNLNIRVPAQLYEDFDRACAYNYTNKSAVVKQFMLDYVRQNQKEASKMIKYADLCKDWGIDPEDNRSHFKWLKDDPMDEQGEPTRALGVDKVGGEVFKLAGKRINGGTYYCHEDGTIRIQVFAKTVGRQVLATEFMF